MEEPEKEDLLSMNVFMDDFNLPPKSLLSAKVKKKNKKLGWETRFLALGLSHLIISRDEGFYNLLNIIPLTAGTFAIKRKSDSIILRTAEREFILKYDSADEAEKWFHHMLQLSGRELTDFISETTKIKQHRDISKDMKEYLAVERGMRETLIQISKLNSQKEMLEDKLSDTFEFKEYVNSDYKQENYQDSIIKNSVKVITKVSIRLYQFINSGHRFMKK